MYVFPFYSCECVSICKNLSYSYCRVEIMLDFCHKLPTDLGYFLFIATKNAPHEREVAHKLLLLADKPTSFKFDLSELDSFILQLKSNH